MLNIEDLAEITYLNILTLRKVICPFQCHTSHINSIFIVNKIGQFHPNPAQSTLRVKWLTVLTGQKGNNQHLCQTNSMEMLTNK